MKLANFWPRVTVTIKRIEMRGYLIAALIAGAVLRIYKLGFQSLWRDELVIWGKSNHTHTISSILAQGQYDRRPSGYQILSHTVQKYFGDSEVALRTPSVIAGVLSIGMIYLLGKRLYSKKEGIWCAVLMACSWAPLFYSQEARPYSMLILLATVTAYLWWEILLLFVRRSSTPSWWSGGGRMRRVFLPVLYVFSVLCICSLHYVGLLFIGLQLFAMILYAVLNRRWKAIAISFTLCALTAIIFSGWYARGFTHPFILLKWGNISPVIFGWRSAVHFFGMIWGGLFTAGIVTIAYLVAVYSGTAIINWRARRKLIFAELLYNPTVLISLWLVVPYAIAHLGSIFIDYRLLAFRYLIVVIPAAYLLCARALSKLSAPCWLGVLIIISLNIYSLHFHTHYYTTPQKPQPREAVYYLTQQNIDYRDSVIICYRCGGESLEYYLPRAQTQLEAIPIVSYVDNMSQVSAIVSEHGYRNIWILYTNTIFLDIHFSLQSTHNLALIEMRRFVSAGVVLLRSPE